MSSSVKRNRISDEQRSILDALYNEGMVGTGCAYKAKIDQAVEETGLTHVQVKVNEVPARSCVLILHYFLRIDMQILYNFIQVMVGFITWLSVYIL